MTLRIQSLGLPDRILSMLGKERAVFIPPMNEQYGYYIARRESFLRALLRSRSKSPPEGWMYWKEPETNNSESKERE
jgi:hypothetical protein